MSKTETVFSQDGYRKKSALSTLRYRDELTQKEIADLFDVSEATIGKYCQKYGVGGGPGWAGTFHLEGSHGYPRLNIAGETVMIHDLVAIAEGADPHRVFADETCSVHHINHHKIDNRPENLEILDRREHGEEDGVRQSSKYKLSDLMMAVQYMLNPARYE
jgi:transcriptional regulator with XRE-family HTH domain